MKLTRLRGFQDLIGPETAALSRIEESARVLMTRYAVREIRTPLLERAELFNRSTGETSDIIEKQMYTFADRGRADGETEETTVALRPEGTPGVVRAYIEAGLDRRDPEQRFFYSGPMFRRERPQKGRYRQFFQFGVEVFGRADAACDAELIIMIDDLRRDLGLELNTELNSLGCPECRPAYRAAVLEYGRAHWDELCEDCHARIDRNPLRLLDCKIDVRLAEDAPKSLDHLCETCRKHFADVVEMVARANVPHTIDPRIVRGLDYYMRTAFEVVSNAVGSQSAVVAGGRYDGLVEALGGAAVPGIGFAIGVDRLALAVQAASGDLRPERAVALIGLGDAALRELMTVARELRARAVATELLSPARSLKALLKRADKIGARYAVIVGENELARGVAQLRDLAGSSQREIPLSELATALAASVAR